MKNIEEISTEELEKILAIAKAKHYEETEGLEYLTEKYIMNGCTDEDSKENLKNFHDPQ